MKVINKIVNPIFLAVIYLIIPIVGTERTILMGEGLLMGWVYFFPFALIGTAGLGCILTGVLVPDGLFRSFLFVHGDLLMILSVVILFTAHGKGSNSGTFLEAAPLCLFLLFSLEALTFLLINLRRLYFRLASQT